VILPWSPGGRGSYDIPTTTVGCIAGCGYSVVAEDGWGDGADVSTK